MRQQVVNKQHQNITTIISNSHEYQDSHFLDEETEAGSGQRNKASGLSSEGPSSHQAEAYVSRWAGKGAC